MKLLSLCLTCVVLTPVFSTYGAQNSPASNAGAPSTTPGEKATPSVSAKEIEASIGRAMIYLEGKAASGGGYYQYSDYVVFCGLPVIAAYPDYEYILEPYKTWITDKDQFREQNPYHSICHVMALDMIGQKEKAIEIFSQLKPISSEGKWTSVPFHLGWYLYGSIVDGDRDLTETTFSSILDYISSKPEQDAYKYRYFVAYSLWKIYKKTNDDKYREMFLEVAAMLTQFETEYSTLAATDGHAGMALAVFCFAFEATKDENYRQIAGKLAEALLKSQAPDGSWNEQTAYTIMPAEGLAAYLKITSAESEK